MNSTSSSRTARRWLRRVGRLLAVVTQLIVLAAPAVEAREDRALAAHVEVPGGQQHPAHHPETCPACILLGVHSRAVERQQLPPIERAERVAVRAEAQYATYGAEAPSNSCRAPPAIV